MDKVINFMNENNNIVIDGKLVFELEQELKHREQECEKLKYLLETKCQSEWEKENERLKEKVEHYRKEAYRLADGLNKTENLAFTYKQALQEIREIADIIDNTNCYPVKEAQKIIDKINEVIGVDNV